MGSVVGHLSHLFFKLQQDLYTLFGVMCVLFVSLIFLLGAYGAVWLRARLRSSAQS